MTQYLHSLLGSIRRWFYLGYIAEANRKDYGRAIETCNRAGVNPQELNSNH